MRPLRIVRLERHVDQQHIQPEKAEDRPGPDQGEGEPRAERDRHDRAHQDDEAPWAQAAMRLQRRGEDRGGFGLHS